MYSTEDISNYQTIKSVREIDDAGLITTYGIMYSDKTSGVEYVCEDISSNEDFVNSMVDCFTRNSVSPIQMKEIICDYIC